MGEATCANYQGGFCYLVRSCSSYSQVLKNYTFMMNGLIFPLATFAAPAPDYPGCVIYIEPLQTKNVVVGSMFFS